MSIFPLRSSLVLLLGVANCQSAELITNGAFDFGFTGFSTDYTFISAGTSTSPGTFGIRTSSRDFNPGYDLFSDHTSGTGQMMLIDGVPNATIWAETVTVLPNTDYTFSAWATTANGANLPTLRFLINSSQVGSDLPLVIPAGTWQNFVNVWNSGSNTTATIAIVDTASTAFGNDLALDDLSFTGPVPEPSSALLAMLGGAGIFLRRRRPSGSDI